METTIKKHIKDVMKRHRIYNKNLEEELVAYGLDEYHMQLLNGQDETMSLEFAITKVESLIKQMDSPKNKFNFSLIICIIFFCISLAEFLVSVLFNNVLDIYGAEMLFVICALLVLFIYTISSRKRRKWFNVLIVSLLLLSWGITLGQVGIYAYHSTMPYTYWTAQYIFPCVIKIATYMKEAVCPPNYVLSSQNILISFNLITSFIGLIATIILHIKEKKNGGGKI